MYMPMTMSQAIAILRFREVKPVVEAFDFPYAVIKGEALSLLAYGQLGQRVSGDIDLLISKKNVNKAISILNDFGFASTRQSREQEVLMRGFSHQIIPYSKNTGMVYTEIDINHDIFWGEYNGKRTSIDDFLSDVRRVELYNCNVFSLPPNKALVQFVLHQYRDMNSIYLLSTRKKINISAFRDIHFLIKNNVQELALNELYDLCNQLNILPYMYYILYYTNTIFPDELTQSYMCAFKTNAGIDLLDCYGLSPGEQKKWKYDVMTRIHSNDLFRLIQSDLTTKDISKIEYNKKILRTGEENEEREV